VIDLFSPCCYFVNRYEDLTFPKVANAMSELESFHHFLGTQLANGDPALTPEECLDLWRAQHPPDEELEAGRQMIQEALDDMKAGDHGQLLQEFLTEFRTTRRLPS
jgi:hypothetical protein